MKQIELTLVLGQYAQRYHFDTKSRSLTELVRNWKDYWPDMVPLPHPSPRNNRWLKQNPWFETELLPELRIRIKQILQGPDQ
jgi:uracil-DNA glycosylase